VILRGVLEIPRDQIFGIAVFLVVLAGILVALPWVSNFFEQVKTPHTETKEKMQLLADNPVVHD
ncbi:MAG: phosphate-starvation-inducible PsiE family protein, partial [Nostoc sp.]